MPDQPNLFVSQHPAVLHKLALLRDERTDPKKFRELVREISWLVGYEALADTPLNEIEVQTPLEVTTGHQLAERIGLVPILRAGLGMVDAFLELFPDVAGLAPGPLPRRAHAAAGRVLQQAARPDDRRHLPHPRPHAGHRRLRHGRHRGAQGLGRHSASRWSTSSPRPRASPRSREAHPDVAMYCAALDRQLNEKGYIQPGLGDAGDRQFGTGL